MAARKRPECKVKYTTKHLNAVKRIEELSKLSSVQYKIRDTELRNTKINCVGQFGGGRVIENGKGLFGGGEYVGGYWNGCGKTFAVKDARFLQKWHYVIEPYNEHHDISGGGYVCPHCGKVTDFPYSGKQFEMNPWQDLAPYFKERKDYPSGRLEF